MKSPVRVIAAFLMCTAVCCGITIAAPNDDSSFKKRLSEVGVSYSLPAGFLDNGSNSFLEKELSKAFDSVDPFVIHQIRSVDKNMVAYLDVRAFGGVDLKDPAFAAAYSMAFESNAAGYCSMVSRGDCVVLSKFPNEAVKADYDADLGMMFMAKNPDPKWIEGHKKMSLVAISKPSKGLFYITIAYDTDQDFQNYFEPLMYSLKFKH